MQTNDYIVDGQGNFRFTKVGIDSQAPLLAKAGIDATTIKTYSQYIHARQAASPFFMEYLQEETDKLLAGKPDTLEWQAIRSIAYGSQDEQHELLKKMKLKQSFKIV